MTVPLVVLCVAPCPGVACSHKPVQKRSVEVRMVSTSSLVWDEDCDAATNKDDKVACWESIELIT